MELLDAEFGNAAHYKVVCLEEIGGKMEAMLFDGLQKKNSMALSGER